MYCPTCGARIRATDRQCDACGTSIPPVAPADPRRWEQLVECPLCGATFNAPENKAIVYCAACGRKVDNRPHEHTELPAPGG